MATVTHKHNPHKPFSFIMPMFTLSYLVPESMAHGGFSLSSFPTQTMLNEA